MAKRAPVDERPYNPIDRALVHAATAAAIEEVPPQVVLPSPPQAARVYDMQTARPQFVAEPQLPTPQSLHVVSEAPVPVSQPSPEVSASQKEEAAIGRGGRTLDGRSRVPATDPGDRYQDRRIPLSPDEDTDLERLLTLLARELGCKVKGTHVGRSLFSILIDAHDFVLARAKKAPRLKRPGNGDPIALSKFEEQVRDIIEAGIRDFLHRGRSSR